MHVQSGVVKTLQHCVRFHSCESSVIKYNFIILLLVLNHTTNFRASKCLLLNDDGHQAAPTIAVLYQVHAVYDLLLAHGINVLSITST